MQTKEIINEENPRLCYECRLLPWREEFEFFCSMLCAKLYAGKNYENSKALGNGTKVPLEEKLKRWEFKKAS